MDNLSPRNILLGVVVFIAGIIGLFLVWKTTSGSKATVSNQAFEIVKEADDHVKDKIDSKVILVEYSDFQCPACGAYFPIVTQVVDKYKDKIAFVYRHYPLPQHSHSKEAAIAAEAAGEQDKFWEMHDALFEGQKDWSESKDIQKDFEAMAGKLKLDLTKFRQDQKNAALIDRIDKDIASGNKYGVNSTPTFYLNGKKLENMRSVEDFGKEIEKLLVAK